MKFFIPEILGLYQIVTLVTSIVPKKISTESSREVILIPNLNCKCESSLWPCCALEWDCICLYDDFLHRFWTQISLFYPVLLNLLVLERELNFSTFVYFLFLSTLERVFRLPLKLLSKTFHAPLHMSSTKYAFYLDMLQEYRVLINTHT